MEIYTGLIMEYLIERATNINPKDDLEKLLKSKKNLRVKLGVDPTAPEQDGENLLDGSIALSPRIHPVDRAIAKQRKNSKPRDKHLWRFTLVL